MVWGVYGARGGIRTRDLLIRSQPLYPLSYARIFFRDLKMLQLRRSNVNTQK